MVDHRASPGIPGQPRFFEAPTLGCPHCAAHIVMNPDRKRPRAHCRKCDMYICDHCAAVAAGPDYVHRSFKELADLVQSGRWRISGTASNPLLVPVGEPNG
jgi:hypothetical protein